MHKSENSLVEGLERLGLIASRIRKNDGAVPQIEIDIILEELRNLYMVALQIEKDNPPQLVPDVLELDLSAARQKAEEEQRQAEEAAARRAAEEKRQAEEAAARRAAEEKRQAEEAAARRAEEEQRQAEEAAARRAAEEKRQAEEAAAKRAAEEKRQAEEAAARRAAEEKRQAEEAAARRAAEEKRQAEEAAARRAAEEKRQAEEAAARRDAEEKRQAEEAAAKRAAEEKRKAAAAALAAAELKPVFAPEEPAKAAESVMEPQLEKLAGNPNDELFAEGAAPVTGKKERRQETSLFDFISKEQGGQHKRTLADMLNHPAHNVEEQLDSKVRAKKVDDLRTIININDKFSFMSELFHNNMKAYNDFILRLNATAERAEALDYVKTVAEEYKWDEGSVVVKSFYKIFDRKF